MNAQNGRPLQIEATLSTPWLWMAVFHVPGAHHIHDTALVTEEITGPGDKWMVDNGTYLMLGVLAAIMVVLVIATRRLSRLTHPMGKEVDLVLVGAFALASAFIVFNKVGSPQYMLWLTPIVAVGLVIRPPDWKVPAILMIPIARAHHARLPVLLQLAARSRPAARGHPRRAATCCSSSCSAGRS